MTSCHFCQEKIRAIDYKDAYLLRRFMSLYAKIYNKKRHGTCSKHQRALTVAIKRARTMALLPFTRHE